jgi:hypothetical protein
LKKLCTKCGNEPRAFGKTKSWGRICLNAAARANHAKNKVRNNARSREYTSRRKRVVVEYVNAVKASPCTDCKQCFHPAAMEFDHLPGSTKSFNIAALVHRAGKLDLIKAEISKCELVCSNCHRVRTWKRNQFNNQNTVVVQERLFKNC